MDGLLDTLNGLFAAWLFLIGLAVGSFLNVVIARLPEDQSIIRPRSRCPHCGHVLRWYENIPLFSFALLRGRCSACHAPISWRYPAIELLTGVLFLACLARFGWSYALAPALVLVSVLVALTFIDLAHWILPFELTLPGIALGVLMSIPLGIPRLIDSVIGAAAGFLVFWGLEWVGEKIFKKEALGGGDKYLLALIGAFLTWRSLLGVIFLGSLQGALVGSALLLIRGRAGPAPTPLPEGQEADDDWVPGPSNIPFGPWLSVAAVEVMLVAPFLDRVFHNPLLSLMFGD